MAELPSGTVTFLFTDLVVPCALDAIAAANSEEK